MGQSEADIDRRQGRKRRTNAGGNAVCSSAFVMPPRVIRAPVEQLQQNASVTEARWARLRAQTKEERATARARNPAAQRTVGRVHYILYDF